MPNFNDPTLLLLSIIASAILGIELLYHFCFFNRIAFYKEKKSSVDSTLLLPISVIICANNEAVNLKENIPFICQQKYPNYEVIVVDDGSSDNTLFVLSELKKQFPNLKTTYTDRINLIKRGKKTALTMGLKAAKYDFVLLTDADCKPMSDNWIMEMATAQVTSKKDMVLGISPYNKAKGLLNRIIQFETAQTALHFCSFALAKTPYMGLGRNMLYRKELFFNTDGFASHNHILSGDDDLFVRDIANSKNTTICINKNSQTESIPPKSFSHWVHQKKRHVHTGQYYKPYIKFLLGLLYFSHILFFLLPFLTFIHSQFILVFTALLLIRWFFFTLFQGLAFSKMGYKNLWLWVPFFDVFMVFYFIIFGIKSRFSKKIKW